MSKAIISLGSNIKDRQGYLNQAIKSLQDFSKIIKTSSFYETEPYGNKDQEWFLNAVISIETKLSPTELLEKCQEIENNLGRVRKEKWGARTLDLDILFYNNEVIEDKNLVIPHKEIAKRSFVLTPLNEIEPEFTHPVLNKTVKQLYQELKTTDKVYLTKEKDVKIN